MKNKQKGFGLLIIVAVLLSFGVAGVYVVTKPHVDNKKFENDNTVTSFDDIKVENVRSETKNITTVIDKTIAWKKFENEKYQLKFQYPTKWNEFIPGDLGYGGSIATLGTSGEAYGSWARPIPENESFITLTAGFESLDTRIKQATLEEETIKNFNNKESDVRKRYDFNNISKEEYSISGNRVFRLATSLLKGSLVQDDLSEGYFVTYYFENKDFTYSLALWTSLPLTEVNKEHIRLFDEMAQTFEYKFGSIEEITGVVREKKDYTSIPSIPSIPTI